jgi:hypothetical protein
MIDLYSIYVSDAVRCRRRFFFVLFHTKVTLNVCFYKISYSALHKIGHCSLVFVVCKSGSIKAKNERKERKLLSIRAKDLGQKVKEINLFSVGRPDQRFENRRYCKPSPDKGGFIFVLTYRIKPRVS